MIQFSRLFIAFSTTYRISENMRGSNCSQALPFYRGSPLWHYVHTLRSGFLLSMYSPSDHFLHGCRLFFLPGSSHTCSSTGVNRGRKHNSD
jgi:hypothetical protein